MSAAKRGRRTTTFCVTVGEREMEMLLEIVEKQRFVSLSEAVRVMIRHYYEATQKCR